MIISDSISEKCFSQIFLPSLFAANSGSRTSTDPSSASPAMNNLFSQMMSNPSAQSNLLQSPFMQQMTRQMMSNPQLMTSVSHLTH